MALDEYIIEGISTNIDLHKRILSHPNFVSGNFHTKFFDATNFFAEEEGRWKGKEESQVA